MSNEISIVFHNGSNYDYHFIIKELANEFKGNFECLGENTEKSKTFSVPIEQEVTEPYKDCNESVVTMSYKIKFIDIAKFMVTSSNLVGNITQKEFTELNIKTVIVFLNMKVLRVI